MRAARPTVLATTAALAILPAPAASGQAFPGPTGKIVFVAAPNNNDDILAADADGSNAVNLTAGSGAEEREPEWAPDGTRIAFSSIRGATATCS
jgi:Tol biopolymer transport system component